MIRKPTRKILAVEGSRQGRQIPRQLSLQVADHLSQESAEISSECSVANDRALRNANARLLRFCPPNLRFGGGRS